MNDGMYQAFRNYLEEHSSQNRQIIGLLERQNELLNEIRLASNRSDDRLKELLDKMQPPMFLGIADQPAGVAETVKAVAKKGK